jgi:hypothetical protein
MVKNMKTRLYYFSLLFFLVTLSSCEIIGDIFQAGVVGGIIISVLVVAAIIWLITRFRGGSKNP